MDLSRSSTGPPTRKHPTTHRPGDFCLQRKINICNNVHKVVLGVSEERREALVGGNLPRLGPGTGFDFTEHLCGYPEDGTLKRPLEMSTNRQRRVLLFGG